MDTWILAWRARTGGPAEAAAGWPPGPVVAEDGPTPVPAGWVPARRTAIVASAHFIAIWAAPVGLVAVARDGRASSARRTSIARVPGPPGAISPCGGAWPVWSPPTAAPVSSASGPAVSPRARKMARPRARRGPNASRACAPPARPTTTCCVLEGSRRSIASNRRPSAPAVVATPIVPEQRRGAIRCGGPV